MKSGVRYYLRALATALLCGLASPLFAQTPPPNDDYENRTQLSGDNITFSGTTAGATFQTDELYPSPYEFYFGNFPTVWWKWTAPTTGQVSIDLIDYSDSRIRTTPGYIAVWENVDWPNRTSDNHSGVYTGNIGHRHFTFSATAGRQYDIQAMVAPYGTFTLRLIQTNAPIIVVQPKSRVVNPGGSTFLGVIVGDLSSPTYQWRFNGTNLLNQTYPILSLDNFSADMAGSYTVVVSNSVASIESPVAVVSLRTNNPRPTLTLFSTNSSSMAFEISGSPMTSYRIESSTNLIDWNAEQSFPWTVLYRATSSVVFCRDGQIALSVPQDSAQKFFRAIQYTPTFDPTTNTLAASEVCINNLRKIRFAKELWVNFRESDAILPGANQDTPSGNFSDLAPFLSLVRCPSYIADPDSDPDMSYATSYSHNDVATSPICRIDPTHHILEEPPDDQ